MIRRIVFAFVCTMAFAAAHSAESQETETASNDAAMPIESVAERGPVRVVVRLDPSTPRVGDTLTLTLEVTAEEDVELLMPSFGQALERFPIVDFLPSDRLDDEGRTVASQRYALELTASGKASIPPLIVEFVDHRDGSKPAPDGEDAYELLTEQVPFEVMSVVPTMAATELKPPIGELEPLGSSRPVWIGATALLLLAAAAFTAWRLRGGWNSQARRKSAYEMATARLDALVARPLPGPEAVSAFFVELSDLIRRYLEDRFELRAPELTTEEFLTVAAASPDLLAEHKGFLQGFLQSADMVKFARFVPGEQEIGDALLRARLFLDQTRDDDSAADEEAANA